LYIFRVARDERRKRHSILEVAHGGHAVSVIEYLATPFCSSRAKLADEFFSIGVMIVFSIVLREKGSRSLSGGCRRTP